MTDTDQLGLHRFANSHSIDPNIGGTNPLFPGRFSYILRTGRSANGRWGVPSRRPPERPHICLTRPTWPQPYKAYLNLLHLTLIPHSFPPLSQELGVLKMGLGVLEDHVMEHVPGLVPRSLLLYDVFDPQQGLRGISMTPTGRR